MTDKDSRRDRAVSALSRRKALAGGATLLTAGGTLVWVGDPVSAQVSVESFSVADAQFESDSVYPVVDVDVAFRYDVANEPIDHLHVGLAIGDTEVVSETLVTSESAYEGTTTLSGRVADSAAWSLQDFAPAAGESVEQTVDVTLTFAVRESDDSVIVEDSATDSATVAVTNPGAAASAVVGGEGVIRDGG